MTDNNNFDFGAFNMNNSGGGDNFNSFWERDSVKNENNSFFSDQSNKEKKKSQNSNKQMNFQSKVQSQVISQENQISLGAFGDPESPSQMKSFGISQRFNVQKQSQQDFRQAAINLSRSIGQIDVNDFEKINGGYRFQKQVPQNSLNKDDNYEILKKYLNEPKKMNFDNFFNDLQKNQDVSNSSFLNKSQYRNMEQYQQFKRKLKLEKRQEQQKRQNQNKSKEGSEVNGGIAVPKVIQINYFKKKPYSSNVLDEDIITFNVEQNLINKQPVSSGFISLKSKPTKDKPSQKAKTQNEIDFFESQIKNSIQSFESKKSNRQPSLQKSKLPMIVDADENIFQTTQQEMKLNNLFNNFKNLMQNYNLLRGELKSNTEGHEKIMKQLNSLKDDYNKKQQQYQQKASPKIVKEDEFVRSEHEVITLNKQQAKQKINQIELDIFKKIQNLQNVVKQTFDRDNDQNNNLVWVNPDFKEKSERSIKQSSRSKINQPITHQHYQSISRQNKNQQILSPLDLRLNINQTTVDYYGNVSASPSKSKAFSPQAKKTYQGLCHQPQHMSVDNFYRNVCVNDNTIVFQSFDFIVSAKYSFIRTGRKHLRISITVKNKTILCLNDFMVIMYGSVGQVLQISPSKMFVQKFGPQQSKTLQAIVDSIKVGGQPIRMQISYRTQRDRKGKVSIKIPRPITKFMDIKFTHESQFNEIFSSAKHQLYLLPKNLNFQLIKSTDDIKLILPFIQINQSDQRQFSYGLVFSVLNIEGLFLLKLLCSIDGTAEVYLKFDDENMIGHGKQILDTLNLIMFS